MRLVLIDSRIKDIPNIVNSFTDDTEYQIFEWFGDIPTIKQNITKTYESVAIIQYNYSYNAAVYKLVYDTSLCTVEYLETEDPSLNTWSQYIDFLLWLKNERGANYIDLMACGLWASADWRYMIETVRATYGIYIRASIDATGEGGDFILESDNFDTIGVYFTNNILQYKYNFYPYAVTYNMAGFYNYVPYTLPSNNLAKLSNRYTTLVGNASSTTYSNVVSIITNQGATAVLRGDGSVAVLGEPNFGGSMPCGVVTQAQLVNVKKIVVSSTCFCALKTDGSIVCWGLYNQVSDINASTDSANMINVNTVRSQLTNIVDIVANSYDTFAAITSTGKVVTWGALIRSASQPTAVATFLASGVKTVYAGVDNFVALKNDGTAVNWGGWANGGPYFSTTYFTNAKPIVDVFVNALAFTHLYIRQNGSTYDIVPSIVASSALYTLPVGTKILKKCATNTGGFDFYFLVLDNSSVVRIQTTGGSTTATITTYTNATDVVVNGEGGGGAYGILQNGNLTVSGTASSGGNLTDATYGLKSGSSVTDGKIVRLVSSINSIGAIKSDNTFVWIGALYGMSSYFSKTFPTNAAQTTLYNATSSNVANVYSCFGGYMIADKTGNFAMLGTTGQGGTYFSNSSTNYGVKDASTNVFFAPSSLTYGFFALEVPYSPSVTPASLAETGTVSYYVSNPDQMGYIGRKYTLYNGATLVSTFVPTQDTATYTFSNVTLPGGTYTLTIKDETSISYTVTSFQLTSTSIYPCFLQGTKILRFNPDTYQDEYIAVESLRPGYLIATAESGYQPIHSIGYKTIANPRTDPNPSNRLYRFSQKSCPTIFEPLYITGEHCTLHREIPSEKRAQITEHMGDVYITEEYYRMPAFLDDRAESYDGEDEPATIWHFALEHDNVAHNYGVFANGLLVESCAIESLLEKSGMRLVE